MEESPNSSSIFLSLNDFHFYLLEGFWECSKESWSPFVGHPSDLKAWCPRSWAGILWYTTVLHYLYSCVVLLFGYSVLFAKHLMI